MPMGNTFRVVWTFVATGIACLWSPSLEAEEPQFVHYPDTQLSGIVSAELPKGK
jgi:hypothetical protein